MKEIFRPIKGYEGLYEVSNSGRVKSLAKSWICGDCNSKRIKGVTILSQITNGHRYLCVNLSKGGRQSTTTIHLLVWDAFGDIPRNGLTLQVDHIDEDKTNNCIGNLQLLTNRQNCSKGKLKYPKTSKYTGVYWNGGRNKWQAGINIMGKTQYIGLFHSEYGASLAYQQRLKEVA